MVTYKYPAMTFARTFNRVMSLTGFGPVVACTDDYEFYVARVMLENNFEVMNGIFSFVTQRC